MHPEMANGMAAVGSLLDFAAGGVFLIACANIALLLLGRAFARSQETFLRVALGANRGQLTSELLWDSVVISMIGGLSSVLLSLWTARVLPVFLFESDAERYCFHPAYLASLRHLSRV
jgi:putative ABC transport system permease protein